jgi:fucose permease
MNTLMLLGVAAGGAIAPYLGSALKARDPRLPFAVSSLVLLATTAGIVAIERGLQRRPPARPGDGGDGTVRPKVLTPAHALWLFAVLVLAVGFQVHASLNSTPEFLRFAAAASLERLLPVFWIGFAVGMLVASPLCRRYRALHVMAVAALIGAVAAYGAATAARLEILLGAQLLTGAAWGGMLVAIFSSASDFGRTGREGLALGTMFSMLAFATLARIGVTIVGWHRDPDVQAALAVAPVVLWIAGAVVVYTVAWRARAAPAD